MKLPIQVNFHNMERSEFVEKDIREKAEKLNQFFPFIMSCRVNFESRHKHHHQGNIYDVHIDLKVPDKEIVVSREHGLDHAHEDAYVAIRDAFDAAKRQLQDYASKIHRDVKTHEVPPHGKILALYPMMDYGLIESSDGREIYFNRNSILNTSFDELQEGDPVRFHEEAGEQGPQASSVSLEGKHHVIG